MRATARRQPLEAVEITEKLRHPNLVAALDYATVSGREPYNPHGGPGCLDYCDRGSLIVRPSLTVMPSSTSYKHPCNVLGMHP